MANNKQAPAPATEEPAPTKRVVLKRELVLVLPSGTETSAVMEAWKALGQKGAPPETVAWTVVGQKEAPSKEKAIEAYAGKPNTPDAKVGAFKAVALNAWNGGREYAAPPKPLVEATPIED